MKYKTLFAALFGLLAVAIFYYYPFSENTPWTSSQDGAPDLATPVEPMVVDSPNSSAKAGSTRPTQAAAAGKPPAGGEDLDKPDQLDLWRSANQEIRVDGIKGFAIASAPGASAQLKINQTLSLPIPQIDQTLTAELLSTHNQGANVEVWKGKVLDGSEQDNIIIVKGRLETHITVATEEGTYTAIVDNASGKGSIVDQADVNEGQIPFDDGIPVPPIDAEPPKLSNRSDS